MRKHFDVRRADIGDEAPLIVPQQVGNIPDLVRRSIRRHHHLSVATKHPLDASSNAERTSSLSSYANS
ncbi:Uncharacterised protein [Mycobacteroides abscessus subsp. abscessus]|nr:Uncharacterised protein [Mycobacteroides abscessus subsp. abscessus]SIF92024.1 Uncharacterised protein [Mycobacteroides abscessus subsp. abscessus]